MNNFSVSVQVTKFQQTNLLSSITIALIFGGGCASKSKQMQISSKLDNSARQAELKNRDLGKPATIVYALRDITEHTVITASMVGSSNQSLSGKGAPTGAIHSPADVIGKTANREISSGQIICRDFVN